MYVEIHVVLVLSLTDVEIGVMLVLSLNYLKLLRIVSYTNVNKKINSSSLLCI